MKQARLALLVTAAVGLAALRWWFPPGREDASLPTAAVVPALERNAAERAAPAGGASTAVAPFATTGVDVPGNAFAIRVPPMPPAPPPPPPLPKEKPFVGPPAPPPYVPPPPPPPPPVQVVGTWDDDKSPGVFISSSQGGTVLARVGTVLLSDYKVTALTPQQITLIHTSSKHEWRLPIPRAGSRP